MPLQALRMVVAGLHRDGRGPPAAFDLARGLGTGHPCGLPDIAESLPAQRGPHGARRAQGHLGADRADAPETQGAASSEIRVSSRPSGAPALGRGGPRPRYEERLDVRFPARGPGRSAPKEQAFADRLMQTDSAEEVRGRPICGSTRDRNSAPEDPSATCPTPARADPRGIRLRAEHVVFPCRWVASQRADPRWLLPMLCRTRVLSKGTRSGPSGLQYQRDVSSRSPELLPFPRLKRADWGPISKLEQGARLT